MARQRSRPIQNPALRAAIDLAGWTLAAAAEAINAVGAENDIPLTYGAGAIAHWIAGVVPRDETIPITVEAFARALGRPELTAEDLGWDAPAMTDIRADPWQGDPVAWLMRLARSDMDRRTALATGLYSLAALTMPTDPHRILSRSGPGRRAGAADAARIRATTRHLADMDDLYGGGNARAAVAGYLAGEIGPLLRGTTGRARPDLFRAASELTYLAGWMAVDAGANGLGQGYYIEAVRLAEEASDPLLRATALRSMAIQAIELGHPHRAVDLAEAAVSGIRRGCPTRTRAWITGAHAEALAAAADGRDARQILSRAERDLERADSLPENAWYGGYRRESFEHQTGTLLASLGDLSGAERHLAASVNTRRPIERRTRALIAARLARVQYRRGRRDAAAQTLGRIRDDLTMVASARIRRELAPLPHDLLPGAPHRNHRR